LKISSVVFGAGPSGVMVVKVAAGTRSPTLMVMAVFLSQWLANGERMFLDDAAGERWAGRAGI
jgi:hypothetical protein